jgi:hypothetical protein
MALNSSTITGIVYLIIGVISLLVILYLIFFTSPNTTVAANATSATTGAPVTTANLGVTNATFYQQNQQILLTGLGVALSFIIAGIISFIFGKSNNGVFYSSSVLFVLITIIIIGIYFYTSASFGKAHQATELTFIINNLQNTLCPGSAVATSL